MLFKCWNACEVAEIGTTLADNIRSKGAREAGEYREALPFGMHQRELESFLRKVTKEVGPLKLARATKKSISDRCSTSKPRLAQYRHRLAAGKVVERERQMPAKCGVSRSYVRSLS